MLIVLYFHNLKNLRNSCLQMACVTEWRVSYRLSANGEGLCLGVGQFKLSNFFCPFLKKQQENSVKVYLLPSGSGNKEPFPATVFWPETDSAILS